MWPGLRIECGYPSVSSVPTPERYGLDSRTPQRPVYGGAERDPLSEFHSEEELLHFRAAGPASDQKRSRPLNPVVAIAAILSLAVGAAIAATYLFKDRRQEASSPPVTAQSVSAPTSPVQSVGVATISSRPDGAEVRIDGVTQGKTPVKVSLSAGQHGLELQNGRAKRSLQIAVEAGATSAYYIDLAPAIGTEAGKLDVTSEPVGANVTVDGAPRGVTPLVLTDVVPGRHRVVISNSTGTISRTVSVNPGVTATVVASLVEAPASAGWLAVDAPIELQVWEDGQIVGTTIAESLMLPAGPHHLEFVSPTLGFRTESTVTIPPGKTITTSVTLPNGSLSINAVPWAEVSVDGRGLGTTPIANVSVPVGTHEIVWKHPGLGERRQSVTVTAKAPVRIAMDFRK
jgi:eukaryotic-like serine/threonine-protein kinase